MPPASTKRALTSEPTFTMLQRAFTTSSFAWSRPVFKRPTSSCKPSASTIRLWLSAWLKVTLLRAFTVSSFSRGSSAWLLAVAGSHRRLQAASSCCGNAGAVAAASPAGASSSAISRNSEATPPASATASWFSRHCKATLPSATAAQALTRGRLLSVSSTKAWMPPCFAISAWLGAQPPATFAMAAAAAPLLSMPPVFKSSIRMGMAPASAILALFAWFMAMWLKAPAATSCNRGGPSFIESTSAGMLPAKATYSRLSGKSRAISPSALAAASFCGGVPCLSFCTCFGAESEPPISASNHAQPTTRSSRGEMTKW
mmetsp:Transcript_31233/g.89611  ORF Transcript_31233/g.89611 Transcript_31233/m.89611 type:complete len:315 (-) Transcript_31233:11-955(-)